MFSKENFIMLSVNTIILLIVIFILFRLQDNKIRYYFKRLDKKLNYNSIENNGTINDTLHNSSNISNVSKIPNDTFHNPSNDNLILNDIDSYIDPLDNDQ